MVVQQPDVIDPHEVNRDTANRIGCIAIGGMTTAFDGHLALILNCDLENSGYLSCVTWLHAAGGLDFLRFCVPYCKVWVIGSWVKDTWKLYSQLLTLVMEHISIQSPLSSDVRLSVRIILTVVVQLAVMGGWSGEEEGSF